MKTFKKIVYAAMVAGLTALPSMVWADTMGDTGDKGNDTNYYRGSDEMLKWAALGGGSGEDRGFYDRQVPSDEFLQFAATGDERGTHEEGFYDRQVPSDEFLQFAALDDGQKEGSGGYYERQAPDELLWAALDGHESTDEGMGTGDMHREMRDRSHFFYDD